MFSPKHTHEIKLFESVDPIMFLEKVTELSKVMIYPDTKFAETFF